MRFSQLVCCFLSLLIMQGTVHTESENHVYDALNAQALTLNNLITKFGQDNVLAIDDQALYVDTFLDFKIELQNLAYSGEDVTSIAASYLSAYGDWAQQMITDSDLLARSEQEPNNVWAQTLIQENVVNSQIEQEPAGESISLEDQMLKQLSADKRVELCQRISDKISQHQTKFNDTMQYLIQNLPSYSKANQEAFIQSMNDAFVSFSSSVKVEKISVNGDYYAFLEQNNPDFDLQDLSTIDKSFLQDIQDMAQNAILNIQACMIDMTSGLVKAAMINDVNEAFAKSNEAMMQEYNKQLAENEKELDKSWWPVLKQQGGQLLTAFSKEFLKELGKQTQDVIEKQGKELAGKIGHQIATVITDKISPALNDKLSELAEKLNIKAPESLSDFLSDNGAASRALKFAIRLANPEIPPMSEVKVSKDLKLSIEEHNFRQNRLKKYVQPALENLGIDQPLTMAFCCSGGGNRAMIGTLGILTAATRAKIFQASMYMAGLSGSTWTIAPWSYLYLKGLLSKDLDTSFQEIRQSWATVLDNSSMISTGVGIYAPAFLADEIATKFSYQVASRIAYKNSLSLVDLYAAMVANFALDKVGDNKLNVVWSSLASLAQQGAIPLPLCSNVFDAEILTTERLKKTKQYEWFETGPFQAGSPVLGYIPIKYFGSSFTKGVLDVADGKLRPEYPISFYLGVYGSAFSVSSEDIIDKALPNPQFVIGTQAITIPVAEWMKTIIEDEAGSGAVGKRVKNFYTKFANFSADTPKSVLSNKEEISLIDGGMNFNFPLPLLLDRPERNVDLVIIYDSNPGDVPAFTDGAAYFARKNIEVPDMSNVTKTQLLAQTMMVLNDPRDRNYDKTKPTFIYFPTKSSMPVPSSTWPTVDNTVTDVTTTIKQFDITKPPYVTPNFRYTKDQMNDLVDAMDYAFTSQVPAIVDIMKRVAQARHSSIPLEVEKPVVVAKPTVPKTHVKSKSETIVSKPKGVGLGLVHA